MEKNKIQVIIFIVLLAVGFFIWVMPLFQKGGKIADIPIGMQDVYKVEEISPVEDFIESQKKAEEKRPRLLWGRDPFQLSAIDGTGGKELMLSGVAVDEKGKLAIINNEIVREGDMIAGAKVIEIDEDSVMIEKEGKTSSLKIFEDIE